VRLNLHIFLRKYNRSKSIILLTIPLILSAFTHLWNPIGFPSVHVDETVYIGRAIRVLEGESPQESVNRDDKPPTCEYCRYDHPYFGQLFLAGIFRVIGYPDSLNPTDNGNSNSIEKLYVIPRILTGLLAVADTFLIYKIAARKSNASKSAYKKHMARINTTTTYFNVSIVDKLFQTLR
jgi:hypothetical protein